MKVPTILLLLCVTNLFISVSGTICFVNFRHYRRGMYKSSEEGVTSQIQTWLAEHESKIQIKKFGFGDIVDSEGSGSYGWILYDATICI